MTDFIDETMLTSVFLTGLVTMALVMTFVWRKVRGPVQFPLDKLCFCLALALLFGYTTVDKRHEIASCIYFVLIYSIPLALDYARKINRPVGYSIITLVCSAVVLLAVS